VTEPKIFTVKGFNRTYTVEVVPGKQVDITWEEKNPQTKEVELHFNSFKLGDIAAHGFYNFYFTGKITKITENTVTVEEHPLKPAKRLKWEHFLGLNDTFTVEKAAEIRRNWND